LEPPSKNRYKITETIKVILKTSHNIPLYGFSVLPERVQKHLSRSVPVLETDFFFFPSFNFLATAQENKLGDTACSGGRNVSKEELTGGVTGVCLAASQKTCIWEFGVTPYLQNCASV